MVANPTEQAILWRKAVQAIGRALRHEFECEQKELPEHMRELLDQLDAKREFRSDLSDASGITRTAEVFRGEIVQEDNHRAKCNSERRRYRAAKRYWIETGEMHLHAQWVWSRSVRI